MFVFFFNSTNSADTWCNCQGSLHICLKLIVLQSMLYCFRVDLHFDTSRWTIWGKNIKKQAIVWNFRKLTNTLSSNNSDHSNLEHQYSP
jgi:hypothetical protein